MKMATQVMIIIITFCVISTSALGVPDVTSKIKDLLSPITDTLTSVKRSVNEAVSQLSDMKSRMDHLAFILKGGNETNRIHMDDEIIEFVYGMLVRNYDRLMRSLYNVILKFIIKHQTSLMIAAASVVVLIVMMLVVSCVVIAASCQIGSLINKTNRVIDIVNSPPPGVSLHPGRVQVGDPL